MLRRSLTFAGLAAAACLALVGCETTGGADLDTTIRKSLPKICDAADVGHAAFLAYVETGHVSAKDARAELAAYTSLQPLCADPSAATSADVLLTAASAYAAITAALADVNRSPP